MFSNGYKLSDIPYHNGYYTKTNEYVLSATLRLCVRK